MGNKQTYLEIDHFFNHPKNYQISSKPVAFKINKFDTIICYNKINSLTTSKQILDGCELINVKLDSHMRDFEVVIDGPKIARGQGIGIIIDFTRNLYIKLWKDKNDPKGYQWSVTRWSTENRSTAKSILSSDLGLGYDVFIIDHNSQKHQLCEKRNGEDYRETPIIFQHLKKYTNYVDDEDKESNIKSKSAKMKYKNRDEKSNTESKSGAGSISVEVKYENCDEKSNTESTSVEVKYENCDEKSHTESESSEMKYEKCDGKFDKKFDKNHSVLLEKCIENSNQELFELSLKLDNSNIEWECRRCKMDVTDHENFCITYGLCGICMQSKDGPSKEDLDYARKVLYVMRSPAKVQLASLCNKNGMLMAMVDRNHPDFMLFNKIAKNQ